MTYGFFITLTFLISLSLFFLIFFFIKKVSILKVGFLAIEITLFGGILLLYKSDESIFLLFLSYLLLFYGSLLILFLTIKKEK